MATWIISWWPSICGLISFLNTSISKKPVFFLEVVTYDEMVSPRYPNRRLCAMMEATPTINVAKGDQHEYYHCRFGPGKKRFSRRLLERT